MIQCLHQTILFKVSSILRIIKKKLLQTFPKRDNLLLQLVEALACSVRPTSVVELSQSPCFKQSFSSISKGITDLASLAKHLSEGMKSQWIQLFAEKCPNEKTRPYRLLALDATPNPRRHANCLEDRNYVHQAGFVGQPVTVGLQASIVVDVPEKSTHEASWVLPLSVERIPSNETPCAVASRQLKQITSLPRYQNILTLILADSGYSLLAAPNENSVVITRARKDRTGKRLDRSKSMPQNQKRGRPRIFTPDIIRFSDNRNKEKTACDLEEEFPVIHNGKEVIALLSRWNNIVLFGRSDEVDVIKVEIFSKESPWNPLYDECMLLVVSGKQRHKISSLQAYEEYARRFQIEHFFRFQKQELLFGAFGTPNLGSQTIWWWICLMSYWLLFLTREFPTQANRPWLPKRKEGITGSPGEVKRSFASNIFPVIGSPSKLPKIRGKSLGRKKGTQIPKRTRYKVVKKTKKQLSA